MFRLLKPCAPLDQRRISQKSCGTAGGQNQTNARFQDPAHAGIAVDQVPRLKVKWAFGFPGEQTVNGAITLAGGRLFIGSPAGKVYSLDAASGCIHWYFQAAAMRSAVRIERLSSGYVAFFADITASVYAVDAATGKLLWKTKADDFPLARVTVRWLFTTDAFMFRSPPVKKSPASLSTMSVAASAAALSRWTPQLENRSGKPTPSMKLRIRPPKTRMARSSGDLRAHLYWSAPAIDTKLNVLYATTGNNYSDPPTNRSNAFVAFDLMTGKILWSRQMTEKDAYVFGMPPSG